MNIRKYFLITDPMKHNPNPGDIMIGNGIEYLLGEAERRLGNLPIFRYVNLFDVEDKIWDDVFNEADYLVLCGTPQLGYSPRNHFDKIYPMIQKAKSKGIITANIGMGSGSSSQNYDIEKTSNEIYEIHRDRKLRYMDYFDLITTRDKIITNVVNKCGKEAYKFIDTVFYANDYYKINSNEKTVNIITLKGVQSDKLLHTAEQIKKIKLDQTKPTIYLCHDISDYNVYKDFLDNKKLFCVNNPESLIKLYSYANQVVSMKMHGSVPALSFGAEVANICMDCRSNILESIGVQSVKLDEFINKGLYKFRHVPQIDKLKQFEKERFINLWHNKCQKKYGERKIEVSTKYCGKHYWENKQSSGYENIIRTVGKTKRILDKIIELRPKSKLLELGCASGASVDYLRKAELDAYGQDISNYAIEEGLKLHPKLPIIAGSIHKLDRYEDESFDAIYSQQVLEHVPTELVSDLVKEIKRVTKVDSLIVLYLVIGYEGQIAKAENDVDKTHWNLKTKQWWLDQFAKEDIFENIPLNDEFEKLVSYDKLHRLILRRD